jgi:hypothetical protein
MTISCSSSFSPSTSACTRTLVRSAVGLSRRAAIISPQRRKISGMISATTLSTPPGFRSGSPAPSAAFMRSAQSASSSGGMPMKLPITRDTTGCATSVTRSAVSLPSSRSSTSMVIALISSSWSAIRLGVKPFWNSALIRSCLGGSIPMNIARVNSSGNTSVTAVTPPRSDEYVSQSRLTAWMSSHVVTDQ